MRQWMVGALGVAFLAAAVGSFVSCRQIVGIQDNPPATVSSACGLPWGTSECASCVQASCCSQSVACAGGGVTPCATYETCLSGCRGGDPQCRSQCSVDSGVAAGSAAEVSALSACVASHCDSACGLSCGSIGAYVAPPSSAASCQSCLAANACDSAQTCGSSVDCDAYVRCILACPTLDCSEACSTSHDAGYSAYETVEQVRKSTCATECAYGGNWTCVGHIEWPTPKFPTETNVIRGLYRNQKDILIAGATVSVCGPVPRGSWPSDPSCMTPVTQGVTDTSGNATIPVPLMPPFVLGGGGWVPFLRIDATGYPPNFYYAGFPGSEANVVWGQPFTRAIPMDPGQPGPGTGNVWLLVYDCLFSPAGGVSVTDENGKLLAYQGTSGVGSDSPGIAVAFSYPAGPHTFTATPISLGNPSSTVQAFVEDGGVTWVGLYPSR